MPSPENSAVTGRNSFGGRISVGGVSSGRASRSKMPHPRDTAFARSRGTESTGTQPVIQEISPCVASTSRAAANATWSFSAG